MNYNRFDQDKGDFDGRGAVVPHGSQDMDLYDGQRDGGYYHSADGFDFWEAVRIIFQRKWLILSLVLLGLSIAAVLTLRQTPMYRSVATIEIQKTETQILEGASLEPAVVADAEYLATQYELLKSRSLAERVAEILNLPSDTRYADQSLPRAERLNQAASTIVQSLRIRPAGRSRVVKVEFVSAYPRETARVANALVENFIESNLERRYNTTAYARRFLEERLQTTRMALEDSERRLASYANEQDILELNDQNGAATTLDANSLLALNREVSEAESNRIDAEQRYVEASGNPNALYFLENEDLRRLREERSALQSEYQEMLGTFKPEFPAMQNLQTRIDAKSNEISLTEAAILRGLEGEYRSALALERTLLARISELKGDLQDLRDRRIDYTILQREVDTNRTQYEGLLQRLKEISIASGVGSSQVSIIDRALVPSFPFEPDIVRALLQALIISLGVGIGFAFGLNYIDDTIKNTEDVKSKLAMATIGVVPKVSGRSKGDVVVNALDDPKSGVSEAFYAARTALSFATPEGAPRSLVVTSTQPGEGKTSTTIALAMAFAKIGQRVLIIDADMRKPSFVADAGASVGLSGLLTRDEPIADNIVSSSIEGLHLLPSGIIPPNPAELLSSPRLLHIISEVEDMFDLVIVDCPPVLGFADAPLLGSICRGAVLVVEAGRIRRPGILRTIGRIQENRTNLLGVVLTKFDAKKFGYEYSYYNYGYDARYAYTEGQISDRRQGKRKIRIFANQANKLPPEQSDDEETWSG
ncbi:MAG: polysaccharide biosynthesis tyrosine autokinase [Pseudomonadota bacterium]